MKGVKEMTENPCVGGSIPPGPTFGKALQVNIL